MSPAGFGKTQRFNTILPKQRFYFSAGIHGVALTSLLSPMSMNISARVLIFVALLLSLLWQWRRRYYGLYSVTWHAPDRWQIQDQSGRTMHATLLDDSLLLPWLGVLRFRDEENKIQVAILLPVRQQRDAMRRLYVSLR